MSKSPSLRRIQADIRELALDPSDRYHATPLENDMFEWHFTIRGAPKTDFDGGVYHGRILLPPEYPFKPPHILFLTPSGRFETNTKICLSFSAFHPELWQPAWGIRLILEALIAFLPSPADGAIGALDWSTAERKRLALQSQTWSCPHCGKIANLLPELKTKADETDSSGDSKPNRFQKEIEELQRLQQQEHKDKESAADGSSDSSSDPKDKKEEGEDKISSTGNVQEDGAAVKSDTAAATATATATATAATSMDTSTLKRAPVDLVAASKDDSIKKAKATKDDTVKVETVPMEEAEEFDQEEEIRKVAPVAAASPPPQPVSSSTTTEPAPPASPAPTTAPRAVPAMDEHGALHHHHENNDDEGILASWLIDPALQAIILILSIICYLLLRKIQALCDDLANLDSK